MGYETILAERRGSTHILTMHRPQRRNALDRSMIGELTAALEAAEADRDCRCVVLTGGTDIFSSGRDLKELSGLTRDEREEARSACRAMTDRMEAFVRPVVAAIEGHCLTGGLELAMACDIRVAGEGSTFGITSARLGTVPGLGGTQRLPRIVGVPRALEMLFSAEPIDAEEAFRIGLVNRTAVRGYALGEALRLAGMLGERAPLSLASIKTAVRLGVEMDWSDALDLEERLGAELATSDDRAEGLAAFLERRKPRFQGW